MNCKGKIGSVFRSIFFEIFIQVLIFTAFMLTHNLPIPPFDRVIQPEEEWKYGYPLRPQNISTLGVLIISLVAPALVLLLFFGMRKTSLYESGIGFMAAFSAVSLTGLITNILKLSIGVPRPNYFAICYPNTPNYNSSLPCTGRFKNVIEGKKSFPSGHSSISFAGFAFISLYVAGQLGSFNRRGRGQTWRILASILPLLISTLIAISRVSDYYHHPQDVIVGGLIGIFISYFIYHQYFPKPSTEFSQLPFACSTTKISPKISSQQIKFPH